MVWPLPRPWSGPWSQCEPESPRNKGFSGLQWPFLDLVSQHRAQGVGVDPCLRNSSIISAIAQLLRNSCASKPWKTRESAWQPAFFYGNYCVAFCELLRGLLWTIASLPVTPQYPKTKNAEKKKEWIQNRLGKRHVLQNSLWEFRVFYSILNCFEKRSGTISFFTFCFSVFWVPNPNTPPIVVFPGFPGRTSVTVEGPWVDSCVLSGPNRAMPPRCAMRFESHIPKYREAAVRFGSVTVWGWNGSSGSVFGSGGSSAKKSVFQCFQ